MTDSMDVMFTCHACGLTKRKARVRLRYRNEDVKAWVDGEVLKAVAVIHSLLAPLCPERRVDLEIPVAKGAKLGVGQERP